MKKVFAYISILAVLILLTGCATLPPLTDAVDKGDINAVKKLLDQGADVNQKGGGGLLNDSNALDFASTRGHLAIAKLLLDRGANVDAASGNMGWTPLSSAAYHADTYMVNLLIDRGADINKAILAELRENLQSEAGELAIFEFAI